MNIREYQTEDGVSPFADWFGGLDAIAAAKVATAMTRLSLGNTSQVKVVGSGVFEVRIHFGPGYRSLLRQGWSGDCHPLDRRNEKEAATRYRDRARMLERL